MESTAVLPAASGLGTAEFVAQLLGRGMQLWTQEGALRFRAQPGALTPELKAELGARKAEVLALLEPGAVYAPATAEQEPHWFLEQLDPGSGAYSVPTAWRLRGALDVASLEASLADVVRRHGALRTTLRELGGATVQVIHPFAGWTLPVIAADEANLKHLVDADSRVPFDLGRGPLFRATLLRLADDDHALLFNVHHAVFDGVSAEVLWRELVDGYAARVEGRDLPMADAPPQYADHACRQRERAARGELDAGVAHFVQRLAGAPAALELPADRPRPAQPTGRVDHVTVTIPAPVAAAFAELCRRAGATPFMGWLAAFQLLLARHAGEGDVVVGTPVANRAEAEQQSALGCFANMIALRARVGDAPSFLELVARVRGEALDGFAHQDVPFHHVVQALGAERGPSLHPVFQAAFSLRSDLAHAAPIGPVHARRIDSGVPTAKFDLLVAMAPGFHDGELIAEWEYAADLFDRATVDALAARFLRLAEAAIANPTASVLALRMATEDDARQLDAWTLGRADPPADARPVPAQIVDHARRMPDAVAVVDRGRTLTYGALLDAADRLASLLRARGVGPESPVAIVLDRSADFVVAALGVMRAGGAYLPLDTAYPADRIAYMLAESAARVVITRSELLDLLPEHRADVLRMDALPEGGIVGDSVDVDPRGAAYAIYTSGSTGRPKGVVVEHAGLSNLVAFHLRAWGLKPGERSTLIAGLGFDAGVFELWPVLAGGAALHVVPDPVRTDAEALRDWLIAERITLHYAPTPLAEALLALDWPTDAPLRTMLTGGEALRSRPRPGAPFAFYNNYGPSENTVAATAVLVAPAEAGAALPPPSIGTPNDRVGVHVVDADLRPVPPGVPGELCLSGASLARGYLHRPGLTAQAFVPAPGGARWYCTGDRVRWREESAEVAVLEFLGRRDRQVKVRGVRIEPGEVEAALLAVPGVREAVVALRGEGGARRLVGYVAADGIESSDLQARLRASLPDYMVPAAVVVMDALPLTANGKVDRDALPSPEGEGAHVEPRTPTEVALAEIWRDVLRVERVGAHDHFFQIGGHSLLATQVASRVAGALGVALPLRILFERPTLAALAEWIDTAAPTTISEPALDALNAPGAAALLERIDELNEQEMDALLASLSAHQDTP